MIFPVPATICIGIGATAFSKDMTFDLDILMFHFGSKIRWLAIRNQDEACAAMYHVYSGFFWAFLSVCLARWSSWFLLVGAVWAAVVLVREFVFERHQEAIKTRTDILTKMVGLLAMLFHFK